MDNFNKLKETLEYHNISGPIMQIPTCNHSISNKVLTTLDIIEHFRDHNPDFQIANNFPTMRNMAKIKLAIFLILNRRKWEAVISITLSGIKILDAWK